MSDLKYKEYSEEESRIYNEAIAKIRSGLENGLSFHEACSAVDIKDGALRKFIEDDALKVTIAELHYGKKQLLQQVADTLKLPLKKINAAHLEMLEDAGITAAEFYKKTDPGGPVGNA
ncbi:MAG TPA: hypothetical protein VF790_08245 [Dissulfurispiraceae bacterium]